jgi:hypothetical protein
MSATWAERVMQKPSILEWMAWRRYLTATRASGALAYPLIEESRLGPTSRRPGTGGIATFLRSTLRRRKGGCPTPAGARR